MYDVCIGPKIDYPGAGVVLCFEESGPAEALRAALALALPEAFQEEGRVAFVRETERNAPEKEEEPVASVLYSMNAGEAAAHVEGIEDEEELSALHKEELSHPRYDGGRSSVLDAIEEQRGELALEEDEE